MTDMFTKEKRSWIMSRIRSKDTKIELAVADILRSSKIPFVRHPKITGSPDFLVDGTMAVFCDGDFWHGFQYDRKRKPSSEYWRKKIERNMKRDRYVSGRLRREGYSVIRLWEHDIVKRPDACVAKITRFMRRQALQGAPRSGGSGRPQ